MSKPCGQHGIATIGFFGGGARVGKDMYANYQMLLGGRSDGETRLVISAYVFQQNVSFVILKVIELFKANKKSDDDLKLGFIELLTTVAILKLKQWLTSKRL